MEEAEKSTSKEVKPPTTYKEQVELLRARKLIINDEAEAIEILQKVNYYRLSAYFLTLKDEDVFKEGVTLDKIYRLYEFDKHLRNLLLAQLESVEVAFRTHIAYQLAHKYGTLGYMQGENFVMEERHTDFLGELRKELRRTRELFITHHLENYEGKFPIWVAVEVISFGALSKLYSNMKVEDRKAIANEHCGIPYDFVQNWLRVLSYVRNVCAHFARIYDKSLSVKPSLAKKDKAKLGNDRIFAAIFVLKKLTKSNDEWDDFTFNLESLIEAYREDIDIFRIGFPVNWLTLLRE